MEDNLLPAILQFQKKTGSCMERRVNSPREKFKITNMADDQVDLTPENIPVVGKVGR